MNQEYVNCLKDIIDISSKICWTAAENKPTKFDPLRLALNYKIDKALEMIRKNEK